MTESGTIYHRIVGIGISKYIQYNCRGWINISHNILNLRIRMRSSNLLLSFHIIGFKAVGITDFQDTEMIN